MGSDSASFDYLMGDNLMSNIIRFSTARKSFRDTVKPFIFHYTKVAKVVNEATSQTQDAIVDTGVSIKIIPDQNFHDYGVKKLNKAMIEKFRNLNGGSLPMFRLETPD